MDDQPPVPPLLPRTHARRLRELYRSAGWPCLDPIEVDLLAGGLFAYLLGSGAFVLLSLVVLNPLLGHDFFPVVDAGQLRHAVLDVFQGEPLPADHPFWSHPRVTVLPHVAAQTDPRTAVQVVLDNLQKVQHPKQFHYH